MGLWIGPPRPSGDGAVSGDHGCREHVPRVSASLSMSLAKSSRASRRTCRGNGSWHGGFQEDASQRGPASVRLGLATEVVMMARVFRDRHVPCCISEGDLIPVEP